jgi:hypothetical protein
MYMRTLAHLKEKNIRTMPSWKEHRSVSTVSLILIFLILPEFLVGCRHFRVINVPPSLVWETVNASQRVVRVDNLFRSAGQLL